MAFQKLKAPGRVFSSFICQTCRQRLAPTAPSIRSFATSSSARADNDRTSSTLSRPAVRGGYSNKSFSEILAGEPAPRNRNFVHRNFLAGFNEEFLHESDLPHRMHVFSHKHNTFITFVQPPKRAAETTGWGVTTGKSSATAPGTSKATEQNKMVDVLLSLSTGNIGFRKSGRGSYDAAYQLGGFALKQIQERGLLQDIRKLEIVFRGFGQGREAVTKALLGSEGRLIRGKITAVIDATRLKQGGTRGKKPRRL